MPGYTKSKKNRPAQRPGSARAIACITPPPTSWPATPAFSTPSAASSASMSAACSALPHGFAGLALSPKPRRSGAISA